jgi:ketopantoate reductase
MAAAGGVHILGAGSIGLVFGEALVARGIPCTLLLRSQAKLAALSALGSKVTVERPSVLGNSTNSSSSSSSSYHVAGEVVGCSSPPLTGQQQQQHGVPIKRLLVTTKANDAVPAIAAVKHRLSQDSVVLLLTNGVLGVYMDAVRTLFPPGGEAAAAAPSFLLGMTTHGEAIRLLIDVHAISKSVGQLHMTLPTKQMLVLHRTMQHPALINLNGSI